MVDVKELSKLTPDELAKVQSVISLFHLLGLSDEDINVLPEVLKNWRQAVDTLNAHTVDLANLKQILPSRQSKDSDASLDTPENIRLMFGFGESPERVDFNSDKGGKP